MNVTGASILRHKRRNSTLQRSGPRANYHSQYSAAIQDHRTAVTRTQSMHDIQDHGALQFQFQ